MNPKAKRNTILTLSLLTVSAATLAKNVKLEEIIVTADKSEENLQDVSVAVTAFSVAEIEERRILNTVDIAETTPGLMTVGKDIKSGLAIRGVSTRSPSIGADSAGAMFVDEVYMPRISGQFTTLLELERIEVLRGPQGTIYGRNATSGAINYVTKRPGDETSANITIGTGNRNLQEIFGTVTTAADNDKLAGSVSGFRRKQDGWNDLVDISGKTFDSDDEDDSGFRGVLEFSPHEDIAIRASYSSVETNTSNVELTTNNPTGPLAGFLPPTSPAADYKRRKTAFSFAGDLDRKQSLGIVRADWNINEVTSLTSLTGYGEFDMDMVADIDYAPEDYFVQTIDEQSETFSQEFRIQQRTAHTSWLIGAYYYDDSHSKKEQFLDGTDLPYPFLSDFNTDVDTRSTALFSQIWFEITEKLSLEAGLRYTKDKRDYFKAGNDGQGNTYSSDDDTAYVFDPATGCFPCEVDLSVWNTRPKWDNFSGNIGLDYHFSENIMMYAKYSTGYHSGGIQGRAFDVRAALVNYDEETVTNYEIGFKSELFDSRMRLNIALFYMDYEDMQTNRSEVISGVNQDVIANAASASINGVEIESRYLFNESLSLDFHFAYLDTEYDSYQTADDPVKAASDYAEGLTFLTGFSKQEIIDFDQDGTFYSIGVRPEDYMYDGTELPSAPEFTYGLALNYYTALGANSDFELRLEYNHTDEFLAGGIPLAIGPRQRFSESALLDRFLIAEEFDTINLFATLGLADGRWQVRIWGKNLTDEMSAPSAGDVDALNGPIDAPLTTSLTWNPGRTYGVSLIYQM